MREIQVSEITKTVRQMCMDAAYHLPKDIYEGLKKAVKQKSLQLVVSYSIKSSKMQKLLMLKIVHTAKILV